MKKHCVLLLCIFTMRMSYTYSQSGALDTSFGNFGIIQTDVTPNGYDLMSAMAIQDDQKILAAGTTRPFSLDFAIVRYWPDGMIDSSFGINGIVRIDFGGDDRAWGMVIQPDGRIIVAGQADVEDDVDFGLARIMPDGALDTTFSDDGKVTTDIGSQYELANTVVVQSDGKIVAAGRTSDGNFSNFAMVRYEVNGAVDTDFGAEGIVITNIREEDEVKSAAVQPDGKIILSGFASVAAKGDFAMVRYNYDGTPDKDFGAGGIVLTDLEGTGQSDWANDMILEEDGKIVLAGNANFNNLFIESDLGVVRYNPDGSLDENFGIDGVYILSLGENTQAYTIVRQLDGKYIVSGKTNLVFGQTMWLLARLRNMGGLDTSFADAGIILENLPGELELITSSLIQHDSRILVGGYYGTPNNYDFTIARYIADFTMFVLEVTPILCNGDSTASLGVYVQGGVAPYMYSLDGINFTPFSLLLNLPAGEYTITIVDQVGRSAIYGPVTISQPPPPPSITVNLNANTISISSDRPGELQYSIDGGITFVGDSVFTDLNDGLYAVLVIDENECNLYSDEILVNFTGVEAITEIILNIAPNPAMESINLSVETLTTHAEVFIADPAGRILLSRKLNLNQEGEMNIDVSGLANGMYFLKLIDGVHTGIMSFIVLR